MNLRPPTLYSLLRLHEKQPYPKVVEVISANKESTRLLIDKLQRLIQVAHYQARLIYFWAHPALLLITTGVALLLIRQYQPEAHRSFYVIFETLFPLAASSLFIPLILREQRQRTLALVSVTQYSLPFLFTFRLLLTILFLVGLTGILGLVLQWSPPLPESVVPLPNLAAERDLAIWPAESLGGPNGVIAILLTLGAPTLLLAGIGTTFGHLTADARVGYLAIFALWMFNRAAGITLDAHALFRNIYLFVRSGGESDWLAPKLVQLILGIVFLAFNWLIVNKPERLLREP